MTDVIYFLNTFNDREKAVIVWIFIFLIWILWQKNIRASITGIFKAFFQKKIIVIFIAMFVYVFLIIFFLYKLNIWNNYLIKDTVFWIFCSAILLLMNSNKAIQDDLYFKKILQDNLKLIIVIQFIVSFYSFSFIVELFFVPIMVFIVALGAVAGIKKESLVVKKIINFILSFIGIFLIIFVIFQIVGNYKDFTTLNNLRSFILPPLMTLSYIPFLYIFALAMTYETLFNHIDSFPKKDKSLANFAKQEIFKLCFLNLRKVNNFRKKSAIELLNLKNKNDVLTLINKFINK